MKYYRFILIPAVLFLLAGIPTLLFAQWEPDVRLTFNDSTSWTSYNNARCIATNPGGIVHVVWWDNRDGPSYNSEIYYKHSLDGGTSWASDVRLSNDNSSSDFPSISVFNTNVHVVWVDFRDGNDEIYYKHSTDLGNNWSTETRLTRAPNESMFPSIASTVSTVHLVWHDCRNGRWEIYYKRSTDSGMTWSSDTMLTNQTTGYSNLSSISVSDSMIHLVWHDNRDGVYPKIYYKRSTNGGLSWLPDTALTNGPLDSWYASISISGNNVYVAWMDYRDGNPEIYFKRSTNSGLSWGPDTRLTNSQGNSFSSSICSSTTNVHIVWQDERDRTGYPEIYFKHSSDSGTTWSQDIRLTYNPEDSRNPSIAASDSLLHVIWMDSRDGNDEIYYKRNPTGNSGMEESALSSPIPCLPFSVRPNPFTSFTSVPNHETDRFALYDVSGRRVGVYRGDRIGEGLRAGVYFIRADKGVRKPVRIVKIQ